VHSESMSAVDAFYRDRGREFRALAGRTTGSPAEASPACKRSRGVALASTEHRIGASRHAGCGAIPVDGRKRPSAASTGLDFCHPGGNSSSSSHRGNFQRCFLKHLDCCCARRGPLASGPAPVLAVAARDCSRGNFRIPSWRFLSSARAASKSRCSTWRFGHWRKVGPERVQETAK